jgi:hypothetical protein
MAAIFTIVPKGMSYANALYALLADSNSESNALYRVLADAKSKELPDTAEKVVAFFNMQTQLIGFPLYVHFFEEKFIGVDFEYFPHLTAIGYDQYYGKGAAQRALWEYDKIPPDKRFDENDKLRFTDITKLPKNF